MLIKKVNRKILIISLVIIVLVLAFLQALFMPKYMGDGFAGDVIEGAFVSEYYDTSKDFDVIFVGDCELYENISPQVMWEEYGIHSYIRGSAQQLIWQSYYLMEETLRYEKPQVMVFNVLSMKYDTPQKETYNRMTLDYMKWNPSKLRSIQASMLPEESFLSYVFPILRYHSRWNDLTWDDLKYLVKREPKTFNGYFMRCDVLPAENVPEGKPMVDYQFGDNAYFYLDQMVELCEKNGVELVLVKAPSLYPYWYPEWDQQMVDYVAEHNLKYYNFLDCQEEIGLDFSQDTYDGGLHLNCQGAEKLATYFGKILAEDCQVPDRREDAAIAADWEKSGERYEAEKQRQLELLN